MSAIHQMLAEVERLQTATDADMEAQRQGDENPFEFTMRRLLDASGLPDRLQIAVEALEQISGGSRHVNGMARKYTAPELRTLAVEALNRLDTAEAPDAP